MTTVTLIQSVMLSTIFADAKLDHFENRVRPLLVRHCIKCHGEKKAESGLRVVSRRSLLKGGDSGPAIVPGNAKASLLWQAIRHDGLEMPPKGKLNDKEIAAVEQWILNGAVWPEGSSATPALGDQEHIGKLAQEHWAFQRIVTPDLPSSAEAHSIDKFVDARLRESKLRFNKAADSRTLIRRLTYDLTGLPATYEETRKFAANSSDQAWQGEVDRLLNSPHFGEHWGRHWLDIARYADTRDWYARGDLNYPYAWTYRDYVVRSFNENLPFDDFIRQQIAADHFTEKEDDPARAALGFLTVGPRFLNRQHEQIADYIDLISRGLLGLTVACARCHDHKYDPIPTADYYSLHGIFASSRIPAEFPQIQSTRTPAAVASYKSEKEKREAVFHKYLEGLKSTGLKDIRNRWRDYLESFHEVQLTRKQSLANSARARKLKSRAAGAMFKRLLSFKRNPEWHNHAFFGPWARLSSIKGEAFQKQRRGIATNRKDALHPEMLAILKDDAVKDGAELTRRMADVLQRSMKTKEGSPLYEIRQLALDDNGPFSLDANDLPSQPETSAVERNRFQAEKKKVTELDATHPGAPGRAMVMLDARSADSPIHIRGDFRRPGKRVPRRFLTLASTIANQESPLSKRFQQGSGRRQLAEALVSRDNPLTARVIVNWVWRHYFGRGFIQSGDFGLRTSRPEQHALLDLLAARLIEEDWNLRWLHREILTSKTYRQSSNASKAALQYDLENNLFSRQTRRRLGYETMRDSMQAVSGRLDRTLFGKSTTTDASAKVRRSLYFKVDRVDFDGTRATFDFPRPDAASIERPNTTVPQQLLFALNSPFVIRNVQALVANADFQNLKRDTDRIQWLYRRVLQRSAADYEVAAMASFAATRFPDDNVRAWTWGYGSGDPKDGDGRFKKLPHFTGSSYQAGPKFPDKDLGHLRLISSGGHPGWKPAISSIVRWTSPLDGEVAIQGTLKHPINKGDGVQATARHNGRIIGEWKAFNAEKSTTINRIDVKRGDIIDLIVGCGSGGPNFDSYQWTPTVELLKVGQGSDLSAGYRWSAQESFGGPPPPKLNSWELAAQALLVSNEFFFVD